MTSRFRWFWMIGVTAMLAAAAGCTRAAENTDLAGRVGGLKVPVVSEQTAMSTGGHTTLAPGEEDGPSTQVILAAT